MIMLCFITFRLIKAGKILGITHPLVLDQLRSPERQPSKQALSILGSSTIKDLPARSWSQEEFKLAFAGVSKIFLQNNLRAVKSGDT